MRFSMLLNGLLKGKLLAMALVSIAVFGGTAAMAASTPGGQSVFHAIVGSASATSTPEKPSSTHGTGREATPTSGANRHTANCPGLPEAQKLAASFSLSTNSTGDAVQAICSLHQGAFKGITPSGTALSSSRVFGYGEIQELLTYARYLAPHEATKTSGTMTNSNARSYLAEALQHCGMSQLEMCLATNLPGFQSGKSASHGKPSSTPTSTQGRPSSTPPPPGVRMPRITPTPSSHW